MIVTRVSVGDASAHMLAGIRPLGTEEVGLAEALSRVLASDVTAPLSLPPWNAASMDGFAVRATDVRGASASSPAELAVIGTIQAGGRAGHCVKTGQAVRIMTGAPVPEGADGVIRVEDTDSSGGGVRIRDDRDAGRNVRMKGEDLRAGERALEAGAVLGPAHLGLLSSCGFARIPVHRRPRVAILATGDELVPVEEFAAVLAGNRIVSSNSYSLASAVRAAGGVAVPLGIARDDRAALAEALRRAEGCDLVLTSGGVSVGDFDFTRDVVAELGGTLSLWRVLMRPGAPIGFGALFGVPWVGLPGNPVSALVTFELFARPLIRALAGHGRPHRASLPVILGEPVTIVAPLTHFLRVRLTTRDDDATEARLTGAQGSGMLSSMAMADGLLIVPPSPLEQPAGARLRAIPLGDTAGSSDRCPA